ncbi:unnamed protein product [Oppiella nova]|uniref:ACAD9/ACADV-like C-terminal domain-containing protein n=1 Tax=Oppiella nova TaxID=334625 RepID=A0A7R9MAE4_9ACAR|nr:unnamed protein product [Oppiella nova]CAG2173501.1 unnamed protein product [Oppiella nova]
MPKPMDVKPIAAIVPKNRVEKIVKYESFIERNFLGEFDKDFLTFPILLKTRQEFLDMSDQHEMVRRLFARLPKDDGTLDSLALRSLHELTVSEMVYVFEAMGAAQQSRLAFGGVGAEERRRLNPDADARFVSLPVNQLSAELSSLTANKSIVEQLIPLVIHNALSYYAIDNSSNEPLRQELLASRPKIGFAYCEPNDNLGALPYVHWESRAKLTNDCDAWLVNGSKSRIFKDNYDYYMVFCRSEDFPGEPTTAIIGQKDQYGIVTLLVPKDMVTVEDDGTDSYGIEYQRIRFDDLLLSRDTHELIKSEAKATTALNVKACGQVVSGAIVLGVLKQLLRNTYDYVVNERVGLTECEITQKMLAEATRKIYAIESMTYLTAAMFDSFQTGADFSLESIAVKTLATEYAYDVVKNLRSIYGSRYLVSSTAHDLINVFDSFLDCAINNRMYLALRGVRNQGQWRHDNIRRLRLSPLYPVYMLKHYIGAIKSRRDNIDLDLDLCGFVHPNLKPAAEWLEYCLKKLDYSSNGLLIRHGKQNIINKQQDLYRLATISMDVYMMTAVISRASHSLVTGLRNSDIDKEVAVALSMDAFLNTTKMLDEMSGHAETSNDSRNTMIHNRNVKYDGYFAMPTIDRII